MGKFQPGHNKKGGRQKGTPNKIPTDLKEMVLKVAGRLHEDGAEEALYQWAKNQRNQGVFWTRMVAPMLPKDVKLGGGVTIIWDKDVDNI